MGRYIERPQFKYEGTQWHVLVYDVFFCFERKQLRNSSKLMSFVPYILIQLCNVNQQNALFKLMFWFNYFCLLHVSNIWCSLSGRLYRTCSFILCVFLAFM